MHVHHTRFKPRYTVVLPLNLQPQSALQMACRLGHLDVAKALVAKGADVNRVRGAYVEVCLAVWRKHMHVASDAAGNRIKFFRRARRSLMHL